MLYLQRNSSLKCHHIGFQIRFQQHEMCVWFHVCLNNFSIMVPSVFIIVLEIPFMFIPPLSEYFIPGCRLDLLITERLAPVSNKNVSLFSLPKSTLSCEPFG